MCKKPLLVSARAKRIHGHGLSSRNTHYVHIQNILIIYPEGACYKSRIHMDIFILVQKKIKNHTKRTLPMKKHNYHFKKAIDMPDTSRLMAASSGQWVKPLWNNWSFPSNTWQGMESVCGDPSMSQKRILFRCHTGRTLCKFKDSNNQVMPIHYYIGRFVPMANKARCWMCQLANNAGKCLCFYSWNIRNSWKSGSGCQCWRNSNC